MVPFPRSTHVVCMRRGYVIVKERGLRLRRDKGNPRYSRYETEVRCEHVLLRIGESVEA